MSNDKVIENIECPKCNTTVENPNLRFCDQCGFEINIPAAPEILFEMVCKECGNKYDESKKFCSDDGSRLIKQDINFKTPLDSTNTSEAHSELDKTKSIGNDDKPKNKDSNKLRNKFKQFLTSPSENIIAVLGQNYLESLLANIGFKKNVMILTDRNLYIKGKVFNNTKNIISYIAQDSVIRLKDVVGVDIVKSTNWSAVLAIFIGTVTFGSFLGFAADGNYILSFLSFIVGIVILAWGFNENRKSRRFLFVNHIGGPSGVAVRWYPEKELIDFRNKLLNVIQDKTT